MKTDLRTLDLNLLTMPDERSGTDAIPETCHTH